VTAVPCRARSPPLTFAPALPKIKPFLRPARRTASTGGLLVRLAAAFVCPHGRLSASQAAAALRSQSRHRAALVRFLARSPGPRAGPS
jgi:hypothetical protein